MKLTPQLEQQIELPHDLIVEYKKTLSWKIEDRELRDVHLLWTADDLPVAGSLAQTFPRPAWTAQVSSQCWTSDTFHAGIIALVGGLEPWMDYDFPIILGMSSSQLTSCPSFFRGVSSNHQPGHVVAIIWKISTAYKSPSLKMRQWFKIINPQSPSMVEYIQVRSGDVRISTPDIHRLSQCVDTCTDTHMEVSWNGGTPTSSILLGFSIINHPFWVSLFMETPYRRHVWVICRT